MGDVHPDTGKIFWAYHHGGKPYFCTPEKFEEKAEKNRIRARENARKNPEKNAAKLKAWHEANPERYKQAKREAEQRPHRVEKRKQYHRLRYINDPQYLKNQMDWVKKNPEKRRATVRKWQNKNYRENPLRKIRINLSSRLRKKLKLINSNKSAGTLECLGCPLVFFKKYIEKMWEPGMSWDNYNLKTWHIDHIKPCASAESVEDMNRLFHYTNLRPTWAKDNIEKSDLLPCGTRARDKRKVGSKSLNGFSLLTTESVL